MTDQTHYVGDSCPGGHRHVGLPCTGCGCDLSRHREPTPGHVGYPCIDCDCQMYVGTAGDIDDTPKGNQATTVLLREESRNGGHTKVSVRVGRGRHSRAHSGLLTLRNDEWDELLATASDPLALRDRIEVIVDRVDDPDAR